MRRTLVMAAVVAVAASLTSAAVAEASPGAVQWGTCPADVAPVPGLQCATLDVPLDYRRPDGTKIQVAISRLAGKNPAKRHGVLLLNQGGPGGPGLDFVGTLQALGLPQSVQDTYDIIGFDPRGVGHSTPVTCDLKPEQFGNVPLYARDSADVAKRAEQAKLIAKQCGSSSTASLLPYITTANTARDMDRIRAALGEQKLSYYGISYGSYLGAVYTTLFPQRSDRILIDSNLGPSGFDITTSRRLAQGMEDRFPDFAKWVAARNDTYGLGTTEKQLTAKYFELAAKLDATPQSGIDGPLFRALTFDRIYFDGRFPMVAQYWAAFDHGAPLPGGAGLALDFNNVFSSQLYVVCGDTNWPESVAAYQRNVAVDRVRYPMFGAAAANIWPCAFWPSDPVEPPVRIGDRGPSNVLMVQNRRDPATPLAGAQELRRALGDRARMVTADEGGHGAYLFKANPCVDNVVTTFLVDGKLPRHDTTCAAARKDS